MPGPFRLNAVTIIAHKRRPRGTNILLGQGNRNLVVQWLEKMFLIPGGPYALGSDAEVGGFLVCVMDERLRAFTGCLNCSSCDLCDGLQLGPRRRWRALSTVFVRCTRVVRTLTWWDELDVSSRVKSGQVGLCRVMSGNVGQKFFSGPFCR